MFNNPNQTFITSINEPFNQVAADSDLNENQDSKGVNDFDNFNDTDAPSDLDEQQMVDKDYEQSSRSRSLFEQEQNRVDETREKLSQELKAYVDEIEERNTLNDNDGIQITSMTEYLDKKMEEYRKSQQQQKQQKSGSKSTFTSSETTDLQTLFDSLELSDQSLQSFDSLSFGVSTSLLLKTPTDSKSIEETKACLAGLAEIRKLDSILSQKKKMAKKIAKSKNNEFSEKTKDFGSPSDMFVPSLSKEEEERVRAILEDNEDELEQFEGKLSNTFDLPYQTNELDSIINNHEGLLRTLQQNTEISSEDLSNAIKNIDNELADLAEHEAQFEDKESLQHISPEKISLLKDFLSKSVSDLSSDELLQSEWTPFAKYYVEKAKQSEEERKNLILSLKQFKDSKSLFKRIEEQVEEELMKEFSPGELETIKKYEMEHPREIVESELVETQNTMRQSSERKSTRPNSRTKITRRLSEVQSFAKTSQQMPANRTEKQPKRIWSSSHRSPETHSKTRPFSSLSQINARDEGFSLPEISNSQSNQKGHQSFKLGL